MWRRKNPERHRTLSKKYRAKNPDKVRDEKYRRLYGITLAQYDRMIKLQNGKCAICEKEPKPGKRLHVDHCHTTKRVRGALCIWCNYRLLGRGLDTIRAADLHYRASTYLKSTFDGRELMC